MLSVLYLVVGIVLILWGADKLTDGATGIARRFRINELVIGLTVVAFGTSLPEFVVSFTATLQGTSGISIGNIMGSNIFNILAIVGITAMVSPIVVSKGTIQKDVPFAILSSAALMVMSMDTLWGVNEMNWLSRGDGLVLLMFFAVFMAYTFSIASNDELRDEQPTTQMSYTKIGLYVLLGLAGLIFGGKLFVNGATDIALSLGMSETVVGLTIVAAGTSLPELATSVVAARKGSSSIAIGNVIGSNLFNVFFILGFCSTISPMPIGEISNLDLGLLLMCPVLLWFFSASKRKVERWEGAVLFLIYIAYVAYLIWKS
ncbi:MAG: calcium/sodium antiporter [Paraprevotella sp.]|nr:calcium/sodium antiporter [Paraprevotella sp.]